MTKQLRLDSCFGDRTVLVHDTGYVEVLVVFPAFAVGAPGKEAKQGRPKGRGIGISVPRRTFDLFRRLFYADGIVASEAGGPGSTVLIH